MADSTLNALTAATAATGGLFYGTQGGADRKFSLSAAGASVAEAADAAAQRTALGVRIDVDVAAYSAERAKLGVLGTSIASASTLNVEAATGQLIDVTGTTTITAITLSEGHVRMVRFTGALTLTHGSSLVLPTAANITTAAGDVAVFAGYASGVVRCLGYTRASGEPLAGGGGGGGGGGGSSGGWQLKATVDVTTPVATVNITGLTGHRKFMLEFENLYGSMDGYSLLMRMSSDGGSTWDSGSTDYNWARGLDGGYSPVQATAAECGLSVAVGNGSTEGVTGTLQFFAPNNTALCTWYEGWLCSSAYNASSVLGYHVTGRRNALSGIDAVQFYMVSGNVSAGKIRIFGWNE